MRLTVGLFALASILKATLTLLQPLQRKLPFRTIRRMIQYHTRTLHECIARRGSHKLESLLLECLAHGRRFVACGRHALQGPIPHETIPNGLMIDKRPQESIQNVLRRLARRLGLLAHLQHALGIVNDGLHLAAMPNDGPFGWRRENFLNVIIRHGSHLVDLEVVKPVSVMGSFVQNGPPRQAGLSTFETDEFKKFFVAMSFHAPFIGHVLSIDGVVLGVATVPGSVDWECSGC